MAKSVVNMYCENICQHRETLYLCAAMYYPLIIPLFHYLILFFFFLSDPLKTSQGMLSLKVFRLSDKMMTMYKDAEFSAER